MFNTPEWYSHYITKYRLAKALRPSSILEVGVRYGYSAYSFLSASPLATYVGVDSDDPEHNCMGAPTCEWASNNLKKHFPKAQISIFRTNTQEQIPLFTPGEFDFVHIDAAHDYAGALKDFYSFWPACSGAMLIDDYASTGSVRDAVTEFVKQTKSILLMTESLTGEALIVR